MKGGDWGQRGEQGPYSAIPRGASLAGEAAALCTSLPLWLEGTALPTGSSPNWGRGQGVGWDITEGEAVGAETTTCLALITEG